MTYKKDNETIEKLTLLTSVWHAFTFVKDASDGESLMITREVVSTNPDLKGECFTFSFHVDNKRRHLSILRVHTFSSLLIIIKQVGKGICSNVHFCELPHPVRFYKTCFL